MGASTDVGSALDVALRVSAGLLDERYLTNWSERLRIGDLLKKARDEAEQGSGDHIKAT